MYRNLAQLAHEAAKDAQKALDNGDTDRATVLASLANTYATLVKAGQVSVYDG